MGLLVAESTTYAFPKSNFSGKTEITQRYGEMTKAYESKYSAWEIKKSKRVKTMENKIFIAYKNLAKAKTSKLKKRYETQIVQFQKNLDAELLRLSKLPKPPANLSPKTDSQNSGMDAIESAIKEKLKK
jgi:hypothetical protein